MDGSTIQDPNMRPRFVLFRRGSTFCHEDNSSGKQTRPRTKDDREALTLPNAHDESTRQPVLDLQIARCGGIDSERSGGTGQPYCPGKSRW